MNIVFATSDLYSRLCIVTIKSLLMNNEAADKINIYYIGNKIAKEHKDNIRRLVSEYKRHIEFIEMPDELCPIKGLLRKDAIVYTYCYLHDILPESVEKVLLIESDVVIRGSIEELYALDISDYYLAAADDMQSKWYKKKLGIKAEQPYFNSGIMLINLKKWRDDNITEKITEVIASGKHKYFYEVQDELNALFAGNVKIFSPRFNCTTAFFLFDYKNMRRYRRPTTCCDEREYADSRNDPVIVHFTTNQIIQGRPWIEDCVHPYNEYYLCVKNKTEEKDMPCWENKRSFVNRALNFVYSKISKTVVAVVIGFVHSFLYPTVLYRFILKGKT